MTVGAALLYLGQRCYIKRRREQKSDDEVTNED
jgi:hypothetical protein